MTSFKGSNSLSVGSFLPVYGAVRRIGVSGGFRGCWWSDLYVVSAACRSRRRAPLPIRCATWHFEAEVLDEVYRPAAKFREENGFRPPPKKYASDEKPPVEPQWFVGRPGGKSPAGRPPSEPDPPPPEKRAAESRQLVPHTPLVWP